jgi:uncharacterized protein involved in exopolysaccharide biosynthesis
VQDNQGVNTTPGATSSDELRDDPIDVGGYAAAFRRSLVPIVAIVLLCTVATLVVSLIWPKSYESRAEILVVSSQTEGLEAGSEELAQTLATLQSLVRTSTVLQPAAQATGVEVRDLRDQVSASVDGRTRILSITASAGTPEEAQDAANNVADALIDQQREFERDRINAAIDSLTSEITQLQAAGSDDQQLDALVQRRAELTVAVATAGDGLALAQEAELPLEPTNPQPVRDTVIAFFASLALALLLAVARDRRRRGVTAGTRPGAGGPAPRT